MARTNTNKRSRRNKARARTRDSQKDIGRSDRISTPPPSGVRARETEPSSSDELDTLQSELAEPRSERRLVLVSSTSAVEAPSTVSDAAASSDTAADFELTFDDAFFFTEPPRSAFVEEEEEDPFAPTAVLTPQEHQRRLWLRARVARLMAGMTGFTVLAVLIRVAVHG